MSISLEDIEQASARITSHVLKTPLLLTSTDSNHNVRFFVKLESEQISGSFKYRGACNALLYYANFDPSLSLVSASTGNHALALSTALSLIPGLPNTQIYLPSNVSSAKLSLLKRLNAPLHFVPGSNCSEAEDAASKFASLNPGYKFVSPYNHPQVMAGQGTIGLEILEQIQKYQSNPSKKMVILASVGGGGLLGGISVAVKAKYPSAIVLGVQPEQNNAMFASIQQQHIVVEGEYLDNETLSDGSAGGIEAGSITFECFKKASVKVDEIRGMIANIDHHSGDPTRLVDGMLLVTVNEIEEALFEFLHSHHKVIEGAAAAVLAAVKKYHTLFHGCDVVSVLCGANISIEKLGHIIAKHENKS